VTDGRTDGQNYDSEDCASIAVSRGKKHQEAQLSQRDRATLSVITEGSELRKVLFLAPSVPGFLFVHAKYLGNR